jgi:hypothetical protein
VARADTSQAVGGGVEHFALPTGMGTEVGGEPTAAADMANADGR